MYSPRHSLFALGSAALIGVTLGACFTGSQAEGLPCTANSQCGSTLECINDFCGGVVVCGDGSKVEAALVCDGTFDCEDGHDEDPDLCGGDQFFCDDGSTFPFHVVCDEVPDCPDGEDEAAAICTFDQCSEPSDLFEFFPGPGSDQGIDDALGLFPGRFISADATDLVFAQRGGSFVRVLQFTPGMPPTQTELEGENGGDDPMPNFPSGVQDVVPYDFDDDGDDDLLVLTTDTKFFGYISEPGNAPQLLTSPDLLLQFFANITFADITLGKVNAGAFVDVVMLTDDGTLLTAFGDPDSGNLDLGQLPFDPSAIESQPIEGTSFTQILLADITDDGLDELIIVGQTSMPQLWVLQRNAADDGWDVASQPIPVMPSEFTVGDFDGNPGRDLAFIERIQGRVAIFSQGPPSMFMPTVMGMPFELGTDINGLAARDINCDGVDDLVFNVESPPAIQVLFGNDLGELSVNQSLTIESAGKPQGNLALLKFDPDGSWDVFHSVSTTSQLDGPEIRSFLSFDPTQGAP